MFSCYENPFRLPKGRRIATPLMPPVPASRSIPGPELGPEMPHLAVRVDPAMILGGRVRGAVRHGISLVRHQPGERHQDTGDSGASPGMRGIMSPRAVV